jgi:outer membrane protein
MNRMTQRLAGLVALLLAGLPLAASAQEVKIGFVDREKALFSTEQGKKARTELQSKVTAAKAMLQPMADEIQALQKEVEAKKFVLSQEALRDMQAKMLELQNRYESKGKELENQLKIDQARLVAPLEDKLKATIEALGKEQGYSLVLERQVPGLIYYAREAQDITDAGGTRYNSTK